MAIPKPRRAEDPGEDWLGTFADTITLLLCFFVLLLTFSKFDAPAFERVQADMTSAVTGQKVESPSAAMQREMAKAMQASGLGESGLGIASLDDRGVVLEFASLALFEPGSVVPNPKSLPVLKRIAAILAAPRFVNYSASIEGHTDDTPPAADGPFPTNWEVGAARASAVLRVLAQEGIRSSRLRAISYGDTQPKVPNRDVRGQPIPGNQEQNRRLTIRIRRAE
jgi:chemotaxis protein MotB